MAFVWDRRATFLVAAAGMILVAGILAAVAAGVAWGTSEVQTSGSFGETRSEFEYHLLEVQDPGGDSMEYSDDAFDGEDGIGLVRAGGVLWLIGLIVAFVATAVLVVALFLPHLPFGLIGTATGGLALVLLLVGLILFPMGLDDLVEPGEFSGGGGSVSNSGLQWTAGLYLGIASGLLALVAPVLSLAATRRPEA